jgi:hypothetical protein
MSFKDVLDVKSTDVLRKTAPTRTDRRKLGPVHAGHLSITDRMGARIQAST